MRGLRALLAAASAMGLSACASRGYERPGLLEAKPAYDDRTWSERQLQSLPGPSQKVAVAVYAYTDQTGQFKPSDTVQTLSRAVTQGGASILIEALEDAGARSWFAVIERERIDNVLRERQIIREMRQRYLGEEVPDPQALPPLLFAGVILEGGIVGYDANTVTGGAGARYLGIGASTKYRTDTVTVYLRAVSVKTGEILVSVNAKKTIASVAASANAFKYVAFKELLEAETGFTTNEPDQLALRQAIEQAVYMLVLEGADRGVWSFADPAAAQPMLENHRRARFGVEKDDPAPPKPLQFTSMAPPAKAPAPATSGAP